MQEAKPWISHPKIILLLLIVSLIILLFLLVRFFSSKQLKLELASHKFAVKRKVIFSMVIFLLIFEMLRAIFELGGTKTGPKPTNFSRMRIVCFLLIFLALIANLFFHMLSKLSFSAEQLINMFQTKTYLFQGKNFQLIGRGRLSFSHWKVKGNLALQDERKNVLDIDFVCLASDSQLSQLQSLLKKVKICSRQKFNWWDWLSVITVFITTSFMCLFVLFLASFSKHWYSLSIKLQ